MNELQVFVNKQFGEIRTLMIDDEPWFVGKDVALALGYKNYRDALLCHAENEDRASVAIHDGSQNRHMVVINESGLYSLIFGSQLPNAKNFKRWVTTEVLPQIRKTGGYIPINNQDDELTIMAKAHQILERTIQNKDDLISELKPKAEVYDMVMLDIGTVDMNAVAKMVGIGEYTLFRYLRKHNILFRNSNGNNVPYERYRKNGCFIVVDAMCPDGIVRSVTRVTQRGIDLICRMLQEHKYISKDLIS